MRQRQSKRDLCANLLLLVDQLENIFSSGITDDQRSAFARLLFALSATRRVWVVATMRSDIYPRLITPGDFLALKDAGSSYDLAAPGESELAEIVRKSAAAAGLVYEQDAKTGERLDDRILARRARREHAAAAAVCAATVVREARYRAASSRRTASRRTPPHEEVRLTFDAYEKMKGLDGAIDETAKAALGKLGPAEIAALPRLLRCLAVPVHDRKAAAMATSGLTVRMVTRAVAIPDAPTAGLVDALIGARIVVATDDLIGIAHQRVFESWEDARNIIAGHRDFFRIREEVDNQFRRWDENRRPKALLLAKGLPLAEAQQIVKQHGDELSPAIRDYVAASSRRAQLFNVIVGTAAAVFFGLFVISTALGHYDQKRPADCDRQLSGRQGRAHRPDFADHRRPARHQGHRNRHRPEGAVARRPDHYERAKGQRRRPGTIPHPRQHALSERQDVPEEAGNGGCAPGGQREFCDFQPADRI